jgi:hypothetical protein
MKLTFGSEVNMQSLPSTPPYMIIRQCQIKHRYFCNFLGCMSLFKCRPVEYILRTTVNAKCKIPHHEDVLGM